MVRSSTTVKVSGVAPPNHTRFTPVKLTPVMVTVAGTVADVGVIPVMTGSTVVYVKRSASIRGLGLSPAMTVTSTTPTANAVLGGETATIVVSFTIVKLVAGMV